MKTITFYSYKGGVGRSLALANVATLLARMNYNVFCLDLDLEAPGLHYKFLQTRAQRAAIEGGLLDLWEKYSEASGLPESLTRYVVELRKVQDQDLNISLMPAGRVFAEPNKQAYWQYLFSLGHRLAGDQSSRYDVHEFFHRLRNKIVDEYGPDFLLIDARTGVTELGGLATRTLTDVMVCLFVNNMENYEGIREIMRFAARRPDGSSFPVVPVLSRFPTAVLDPNFDSAFYEQAIEPEYSLESFDFPRPIVLHSSLGLEWEETISSLGETDELIKREYQRLTERVLIASGEDGVEESDPYEGMREEDLRSVEQSENERRTLRARSLVGVAASFRGESLAFSTLLESRLRVTDDGDERKNIKELVAWERDFFALEEFWVLLPRFLAAKHGAYIDAMAENLRRGVRYVYFLSSPAEREALSNLALKLRKEVGLAVEENLCYFDTGPHPFLSKFLQFTNYWIANPNNPYSDDVLKRSGRKLAPRGFEVYYVNGEAVGGRALTERAVVELRQLVASLTGNSELLPSCAIQPTQS